MKIYRDPKGLKLKPCLNCVATQLLSQLLLSDTELYKRCPCSNHSGEIHRDNGKIVLFTCENRKMHPAPMKSSQNAPEKPSKAHRAKKRLKVSQSDKAKTR